MEGTKPPGRNVTTMGIWTTARYERPHTATEDDGIAFPPRSTRNAVRDEFESSNPPRFGASRNRRHSHAPAHERDQELLGEVGRSFKVEREPASSMLGERGDIWERDNIWNFEGGERRGFFLTEESRVIQRINMPVRRGHVAPQNTFLGIIIRKFEGQSKYLFFFWCTNYCC